MAIELTDLSGADLREQLRLIVVQRGKTYEQLETEATPLIDECNRRGKALADKYGRKFRRLTFIEARQDAGK